MDERSQHLIICTVAALGLVALLGSIHSPTSGLHDIAVAVVSGLCGALCPRNSSVPPKEIPHV